MSEVSDKILKDLNDKQMSVVKAVHIDDMPADGDDIPIDWILFQADKLPNGVDITDGNKISFRKTRFDELKYLLQALHGSTLGGSLVSSTPVVYENGNASDDTDAGGDLSIAAAIAAPGSGYKIEVKHIAAMGPTAASGAGTIAIASGAGFSINVNVPCSFPCQLLGADNTAVAVTLSGVVVSSRYSFNFLYRTVPA